MARLFRTSVFNEALSSFLLGLGLVFLFGTAIVFIPFLSQTRESAIVLASLPLHASVLPLQPKLLLKRAKNYFYSLWDKKHTLSVFVLVFTGSDPLLGLLPAPQLRLQNTRPLSQRVVAPFEATEKISSALFFADFLPRSNPQPFQRPRKSVVQMVRRRSRFLDKKALIPQRVSLLWICKSTLVRAVSSLSCFFMPSFKVATSKCQIILPLHLFLFVHPEQMRHRLPQLTLVLNSYCPLSHFQFQRKLSSFFNRCAKIADVRFDPFFRLTHKTKPLLSRRACRQFRVPFAVLFEQPQSKPLDRLLSSQQFLDPSSVRSGRLFRAVLPSPFNTFRMVLRAISKPLPL